jgi:hypothetical protein
MMKQPIRTKYYLLFLDMYSNLKVMAENKIFRPDEAIKMPESSFAIDQTAVMCFFKEHGI